MSPDRIDTYLLAVLHDIWQAPVPPQVEGLARELLLDTLGCAIAGSAEPELQDWAVHLASYDPGALRFPGIHSGLTSGGLAQWFAAAACWHEACEGLASAHGRPGLHALSAIIGPALARPTSLAALLEALIAGYEIGGRLGAICRIKPGMHVDGTWGSFAAAAAFARRQGLSPEQTLSALNHAACHMPFSLYRTIPAGSMARNAYAGHGAHHGVASVLAAISGLFGPPGGVAAMTDLALGTQTPELAAPPGQWLIAEGYLKLYPSVKHTHYGVTAAEAFVRERPFPPNTIERVTLSIYAEARTYCGNRQPTTAIAAQFSLSYCLAWTILYGRLAPAAFRADSLQDPAVRRLEMRVDVVDNPSLTAAGERGAILRVEAAGSIWEHRIGLIKGDPGYRLSREDLVGKFHDFAGPVIGEEACKELVRQILEGGRETTFHLVA